jgi:flagellar biosynthetic protein FlhB
MADEQDQNERTEDPTQRRLDEALKRGDVAKSQEVNTWFVISAAALVLIAYAGTAGGSLTATLRGIVANSYRLPTDGIAFAHLIRSLGVEVLAAFTIPFLLLALAAAGGNIIQHRLVWSFEQLTPRLSKISPIAGLKRQFSTLALLNFVKGILKLALVGGVLFALLWPERNRLEEFITFDIVSLLMVMRTLTLKLLGAVVAMMAIIAIADFLFQYRQWYERQKMSVRELKDEFKDTEGDPKIKARIRQLRQNRMKKRMMAAVPKATVVITNPTHFAVALQYERGMNAPVCVAKGADLIALKIREVAARHGIPLVENPPLARILHATVEIDQEIPPDHYRAVAEVIGYVMRLTRRMGG